MLNDPFDLGTKWPISHQEILHKLKKADGKEYKIENVNQEASETTVHVKKTNFEFYLFLMITKVLAKVRQANGNCGWNLNTGSKMYTMTCKMSPTSEYQTKTICQPQV